MLIQLTTLALLLMAVEASSAQEPAKTITRQSFPGNEALKMYKPGRRKPEEMPPDIYGNEIKRTTHSDSEDSATVKAWCEEHRNLLKRSILQNSEFAQLTTKKCEMHC
ncbi:MAG: hypothetical protein KIT34_02435 [Cyanobacteria bacterium TGS_CYA1]|nr:hypothetical protein [Cyanobacteria bacterium TGS_CYA1]